MKPVQNSIEKKKGLKVVVYCVLLVDNVCVDVSLIHVTSAGRFRRFMSGLYVYIIMYWIAENDGYGSMGGLNVCVYIYIYIYICIICVWLFAENDMNIWML